MKHNRKTFAELKRSNGATLALEVVEVFLHCTMGNFNVSTDINLVYTALQCSLFNLCSTVRLIVSILLAFDHCD